MAKDDAPLMPFWHKLEQLNQELQDTNSLGLDTEAMKQQLKKITQERLETLQIARKQLETAQFKRLKRLVHPLAKDIEKVGAPSEVNPCMRSL